MSKVVNWYRSCPECSKEISYGSKGSRTHADKKGSLCKSCANTGDRNVMYGRTGNLNPFYGKTHTPETKTALSELRSDWFNSLSAEEMSDHLAQLADARDSRNPRLSNFEYWSLKYGEDEATIRWNAFRKNLSEINSGKGNPMYGKTTPVGAGVGWGGWYRGIYFRSLRELSFLVSEPLAMSAESSKWRASYTHYNGTERTTIPDFVIEESKRVIECKPTRLHDSPLVTLKSEAIRCHVEELGYTYEIVDPALLEMAEFENLLWLGEITLTEKTYERYTKWKNKTNF